VPTVLRAGVGPDVPVAGPMTVVASAAAEFM